MSEPDTITFRDLTASYDGQFVTIEDVIDDVIFDVEEAQALRDWLVKVLP